MEALRDGTVDDPSCLEAAVSLKLRSLERTLVVPGLAPVDVDVLLPVADFVRAEGVESDGGMGVRS